MTNAKLTIQRDPSQNKLWYWTVVYESGKLWTTSKESYESVGLALIDARENGHRALMAAESAKLTSGITAESEN